jgi:hypothetical protein
MTTGVREGFAAVRALGLTVTPFPLKVLFTWLPQAFAVRYWRRFFASKIADYVFGRHARTAAREMREVANDCRALLDPSGYEVVAIADCHRGASPSSSTSSHSALRIARAQAKPEPRIQAKYHIEL